MRGENKVVEIGMFASISTKTCGIFFVQGKDTVIVKGSHDDEIASVKTQSISKSKR